MSKGHRRLFPPFLSCVNESREDLFCLNFSLIIMEYSSYIYLFPSPYLRLPLPFPPSFSLFFFPFFLPYFLPSLLTSFLTYFLTYLLPYLLTYLLPYLLTSLLPSFISSFLPSFLTSLLPYFFASLFPLHSFIYYFFLSICLSIFFRFGRMDASSVDRIDQTVSIAHHQSLCYPGQGAYVLNRTTAHCALHCIM